jgi:hypothetical protein
VVINGIHIEQKESKKHPSVTVALNIGTDDNINVSLSSPSRIPRYSPTSRGNTPNSPVHIKPSSPNATRNHEKRDPQIPLALNNDIFSDDSKTNDSVLMKLLSSLNSDLESSIPSSPIVPIFRTDLPDLHKIALSRRLDARQEPVERNQNRQSVELRALQSAEDTNLSAIDSSALFVLEDSLDDFDKTIAKEKESKITDPEPVQEVCLSPKSAALSKLSPRPDYAPKPPELTPLVTIKQGTPMSSTTPTTSKKPSPPIKTNRTTTPKVLQRSNTLSTMSGEKKQAQIKKTTKETTPTTNGTIVASENKRPRNTTPSIKKTPRSSSAARYVAKETREVITPTTPYFTQEDLDSAREEGVQKTLKEWSIVQMDYDQLDKENREQKNIIESLRKELASLTQPEHTRLKEMEQELRQLRDTEKHMTESFTMERNKHNSELQKTKERLEEEFQSKLTDARQTLEDHYDTLRKELENKVELAVGQAKALTSKNVELVSENKKLKVHKEAASKILLEYKNATNEIKTLQNDRTQLQQEKGQLQQSEAGLKKKANEAEKKLTEAQALSKKLKEETVAFRSRIEELEKQKREIDGERDSISNELAGVKKRAEETEKALKEKEAEALRMKGQIYDAMVEIENLKKSNAEIALLKSQVDLRDRALVSLQDEKNKNNREWEDICNELLKKCEAHGIV